MTEPQKYWSMPARAGEILSTLFIGMFFGGILALLGAGFLAGPPTTTTEPGPATTVTVTPSTTTVPFPTTEKCSILVQSFHEYGSRSVVGPPTPDFLESALAACNAGEVRGELMSPAEFAEATTECAVWDLGQLLSERYFRLEGIETVPHSPCPVTRGGPPPVMK